MVVMSSFVLQVSDIEYVYSEDVYGCVKFMHMSSRGIQLQLMAQHIDSH